MAWEQNQRRASFKGLPFEIDDIQEQDGINRVNQPTIGGRVVSQNMGRATRTFTIQGFFVESPATPDPYLAFVRFKRTALQNDGERGTFVHPHLGDILNCGVISISDSVSKDELGKLNFSLVLDANLESGYTPPPIPAESNLLSLSAQVRGVVSEMIGLVDATGNIVGNTLTNITGNPLIGDLAADFVDRRVDSQVARLTARVGPLNFGPGSVLQPFKPLISPTEQAAWTNTLRGFINRSSSAGGGYTQRGERIISQFREATSIPTGQIRDIAAVGLMVRGIFKEQRDPTTSSDGLLTILEHYASNPSVSTPSRRTVLRDNAQSNNELFNIAVALEAQAQIGETLATTPIRESFNSRRDAQDFIDRATDSALLQAATLQNKGALGSVQVLQDQVVALQRYSDEFVPSVNKIRVIENAPKNALVISNQVNGDAELVAEIFRENNAIFPGDLHPVVEVRG